MAAQLLGTVGKWGIASDETGIIITDLSFDFSNQEKPVLSREGEIIGMALYQQKVEIKLSGLVAKDSPFNGTIGTALTMANAIPAHLTASGSSGSGTGGGNTLITQISRSLNVEDFEKIDVTAVNYPFITGGN